MGSGKRRPTIDLVPSIFILPVPHELNKLEDKLNSDYELGAPEQMWQPGNCVSAPQMEI